MFPFPRTLPLLSPGALAGQTVLHVLVPLVSLVEFPEELPHRKREMFTPDLRAKFTDWRSWCLFDDDPACGSFSDNWLTCFSLVGDYGSFAHSGVVAPGASMLS